ncbi:MAG: acyltransferase [Ruthenibacterium sp.]
MTFLKLYFHMMAALKKGVYKLLYGRRIHFGRKTTFRRSLALAIEKTGCVTIGDGCFFNNGCSISSQCGVTIGAHTVFGEHVCLYDHDHAYRDCASPAGEQGYTTAPVILGAGCWLGSNVTVLKGTVLGDHVVVGAGCVLRGIVPSGTLVTQSANVTQRPIAGQSTGANHAAEDPTK